MSVNKVILIGRLGKDPETRYMPSGEEVTNATLATSENYKDKEGKKIEKTEWHTIVFYRRLAEVAGEYLKKGSMIYVEGRLQTRKWEKDGIARYITEIIVDKLEMLGGKDSNNEERPPPARSNAPAASTGSAKPYNGGLNNPIGAGNQWENDIPFAPRKDY